MPLMLDRPGRFKATPMHWGFKKGADSESVQLMIAYKILAELVDGEWNDWTEYDDVEITGSHNIVMRTGKTNADGVLRLIEAGVWNGSTNLDMAPESMQCQITVETKEFNGRQKLEVAWVNHINSRPAAKEEDSDGVKAIGLKYGGEFRAIAAKAKVETSAKPKPAPPAAKPAAQRVPDDDDLAWMNEDPGPDDASAAQ